MRSFLGGITKIHCYIVVSTINDSGYNVFMRGLTEAESEREESGAKITSNRKRSSQENRKRELHPQRGQEKGGGTVLSNAVS